MKTALFFAALIAASPDAGSLQPIGTVVSMISLIANPNDYDGKLVRVSGFVRCEFEESALYFHKDDADFANSANAIWLSTCSAPKPGWYVIEGQFDASAGGHLGAYPGTLQVTRIFALPSRAKK